MFTAFVTLAGCQSNSTDPYSLVFENQHKLPHVLTVTLHTFSPDGETQLTEEQGQIFIEAEDTTRYTGFFDPSQSYRISVKFPGSKTIHVPYGRQGIDIDNNFVYIEITDAGTLNGGIRNL